MGISGKLLPVAEFRFKLAEISAWRFLVVERLLRSMTLFFSLFVTLNTKNTPRCLWHNLCGSSGVKSDSFAMIHEASTAVLTLIIKHALWLQLLSK